MGLDAIPTRANGQYIDQDWFNLIERVLIGDMVPRSVSGLPTDIAGNLGTAAYRWGALYIQSLYLGTSVNPITLQVPAGMSAPYTWTFPATLPASNQPLYVDQAGIITTAKPAVGQQISASSGSFSTTSTTLVDVTNLTVTLTTTGRPVKLMLISDGSASSFQVSLTIAGNSNASGAYNVEILRDGSVIANFSMTRGLANATASAAVITYNDPSSLYSYLDMPPAGTHTYKIQVLTGGGATLSALNMKLVAYEVP